MGGLAEEEEEKGALAALQKLLLCALGEEEIKGTLSVLKIKWLLCTLQEWVHPLGERG